MWVSTPGSCGVEADILAVGEALQDSAGALAVQVPNETLDEAGKQRRPVSRVSPTDTAGASNVTGRPPDAGGRELEAGDLGPGDGMEAGR